ncbi:MAG TPA: hypothetical protein VGA78_09240 [Gemmatimonadales bacterium]
MGSLFRSVAFVSAVFAAPAVAQSAQFPATPQGQLAAGFFAAVNSPDETALVRFQDANFSEAALKRMSREQREAKTRQLRDQAGSLTLQEVRSAGSNQLVVIARGANLPANTRLTITFNFTSGSTPKIDSVQIV